MRFNKGFTIKYFYQIICWVSIFLLTLSCGTSKIPKGDLLYVGAEIKVEGDSITKKERKKIKSVLEGKVRPIPNKSFLGLRPGIFFYNLAGETKKNKGFRYWLRTKVGEAPVLFSQVDMAHNAEVLQSYLQNIGYFNAVVSTDSVQKKKTGKMIYTTTPQNIFRINSISYQGGKSPVGRAIDTLEKNSFIKEGNPFDLNTIISERERIDRILKEEGYYYFSPDYMIAVADSTLADNKVNLKLEIKKTASEKALNPYHINKIYIYPDYNLSEEVPDNPKDTLSIKGVEIIDPKNHFKPSIFREALFFSKGDLYNRTDHNLTLNRLINLGVFKFVKNEFKESSKGKDLLDVYYYLTPNETKSIYLETSVKTNSAGYYGSELSLNWSHNNLFKGAEKLNFKLFGGLDFQLSGRDEGFNIYQIGTEVSLTFPRFITPFKELNTSGRFTPKTKATVGYSYLLRQKLYGLHSFKASWRYLWKENIRKEHNLSLLDVNYVRSENVSELYEKEIAKNPSLGRVVEKQLIFGPTYSFTYTNSMLKKAIRMYYNGTLDLSGNLTGLIWGADATANKVRKIAGVAFSQYAKTEQDIRYYFSLGENSEIATRFVGGIAYPYGNSLNVPHSKQFYIGGSNSIRAFHTRTLGPGATPESVDATFLYDRSGDIKLEANLEYRAKLFSVVNGALFLDAGNVWSLENTDEFPDGKFSKNFMEDVAVGVGAGIRFDLSFLVLRFDWSFPVRKPYLKTPSKWVFKDIAFGKKDWRSENLILNIAIGYPF